MPDHTTTLGLLAKCFKKIMTGTKKQSGVPCTTLQENNDTNHKNMNKESMNLCIESRRKKPKNITRCRHLQYTCTPYEDQPEPFHPSIHTTQVLEDAFDAPDWLLP